MKLHLGCGQRYLQGYVNIDFPSSEHSVQETSVADRHADILTLNFDSQSIDEVRLHHVFEHFPRPIACALLVSWYSWLKPRGILHLEVPDFQRTAWVVLKPWAPFSQQAVAERHIFGSHEASWAAHCEGYTPKTLSAMVNSYGFKVLQIRKNHWKGTYNFELLAEKQEPLTRKDFAARTRGYLGNFLLDDSEAKLLQVWLEIYARQLEVGWAGND